MGLYKINRRPKDIADIKPRTDNNTFCQPTYSKAGACSVSSDSKQGGSVHQLQMTKNATAATQSTIAERRDNKLASKLKIAVKDISPQQIQLPMIKDTSEGDPSVLSDARGIRSSDGAISIDLHTQG